MRLLVPLALLLSAGAAGAEPKGPWNMETGTAVRLDVSGRMMDIYRRLEKETIEAHDRSPFSVFTRDYFARFSRDPAARPGTNEVAVGDGWALRVASPPDAPSRKIAEGLADLLERRLGVKLAPSGAAAGPFLELLPSGGGTNGAPGSFTLSAAPGRITVAGADEAGLCDGIAKLAELFTLREAPFLPAGTTLYRPRLRVRLGMRPLGGSYRDVVFMGHNAVLLSDNEFFALSRSDALPELASRREPAMLARLEQENREARAVGLRTYMRVNTVRKFGKDDPVFLAHPGVRGALTWKGDGDYILCPEHPLVQRYHEETVESIFRAAPGLDGLLIIVGGEGFYHCFMRAHGVEKGHTNCARCEALGPDRAVANLCNRLAAAARRVNPRAEIGIWPYSAFHIWSSDLEQSGLIRLLEPGTALFTEVEKDEVIEKAEGVRKVLWDYSIDQIGLGPRALRQVALARERGIPVHLKSEPEISLESPGLSHIPCLDRWLARAEAMAASGADGAWIFPAFRPSYGSSAAEVARLAWWDPAPGPEAALEGLARRIAGPEGGPHLRRAWSRVSEAMGMMPEIPPYYLGPHYLGPAHPMCAKRGATYPPVFFGYYLFESESIEADGLQLKQIFMTQPRKGEPPYIRAYRAMEAKLREARDEVDRAEARVDPRHRAFFQSEASPVRWFYHLVRSVANFLDSCDLRDKMSASEDPAECAVLYRRWREVLEDEKANAEQALPVMKGDVRLDFYYGGDHSFCHGADMIRAKLALIDWELREYLPSRADAKRVPR